MRVKYTGPRDSIGVAGYGLHLKDEVKDYSDEVGVELVTTSVRQHFEAVDGLPDLPTETDDVDPGDAELDAAVEEAEPPIEAAAPDFEEWTVKKLTQLLEKRGIEIPKKALKAELIELITQSA